MAKVLPYVESVVVTDSNGLRTWIGHPNDDVPDWVLDIASSPRAFELDTPTAEQLSTFPARFPATF